MIDNLGFHTQPSRQAELTTLQAEIRALTAQVTADRFHSWEARHNTYGDLNSLRTREANLIREAAMEDQRLTRLANAVRLAGDADLGFIAYVVFGPDALPVEPLYEVRLVDTYGYTVPDSVRTNLSADRVERVKRQLLTVNGPEHARLWGWSSSGYRVQVTPF